MDSIRKKPKIFFYLPEEYLPQGQIPEDYTEFWDYCVKNWNGYYAGILVWTLKTYLLLKDYVSCKLVTNIPEKGIIIAHRKSLPAKPKPKQLFVCIKADKSVHPYSQIHLVQNSCDCLFKRSPGLWQTYYVPRWPQDKLKPRSKSRGTRLENVGYYGVRRELAKELQSKKFERLMQSNGFKWHIFSNPKKWVDYSKTDAIVAVRSFKKQGFNNKLASKLYNAWRAGVPVLLGPETAYQNEKKSRFDYMEVNSANEIISALKSLRKNHRLYKQMVNNGIIRSKEVSQNKIIGLWKSFLVNVAVPAYRRHCKNRISTNMFLLQRYFYNVYYQLHFKFRSKILYGI